jgi:hypothetical protein
VVIEVNKGAKMKQIQVNSMRKKALFWWRSLSKDMKMTMIHNPSVNKTNTRDFELMSRSTMQVEKMFKNWLSWEIDVESVWRTDPEQDEHPRFRKGK